MLTEERLWPVLRTLPRPIWVLFFGQFLNRFGSFVYVFLVVWVLELGFSVQQAGLAVSIYGLGSLVAALVGGQLADRIGRRETIVASMFGSAATLIGLEMAATLPTILLGAAAFGFAGELYRPAASALLADLTDDENRVVTFAGYRLAINLGFAFGPAIAGFMATRSFTWLFYGDAATSVLFGVLAIFMLPGGVPSTADDEEAPVEQASSWSVLFRDRRFLLFLGAAFLNATVFVQAFSTFAIHVTSVGFSEADYGLLMSFNGAVIVLAELPIVKWSRIRPSTPVMVIGILLVGAGFFFMGWATTLFLLFLGTAVWTLGEMVVAPVASAHVARISPMRLRGRYAGAVGLAFSVAGVVAPAGGAALYEFSPTFMWSLCGVVSVGAAWLLVESERVGRRDRRAGRLATV